MAKLVAVETYMHYSTPNLGINYPKITFGNYTLYYAKDKLIGFTKTLDAAENKHMHVLTTKGYWGATLSKAVNAMHDDVRTHYSESYANNTTKINMWDADGQLTAAMRNMTYEEYIEMKEKEAVDNPVF